MPELTKFAVNLRRIREAKGISCTTLSFQLGSGHHSLVSHYECCYRRPNAMNVFKLVILLDTTYEELSGGEPIELCEEASQAVARVCGMTPREYETFMLHTILEIPQYDVAEMIGIRQSNVSRMSRRATDKLLEACDVGDSTGSGDGNSREDGPTSGGGDQ